MRLFVSSDRRELFFVRAARKAVDQPGVRAVDGGVQLVFPPQRIGIDTGNLLENVLTILSCEAVFINVTPRRLVGGLQFNPGVIIEYGLVLGKSRMSDLRWPRPYYRLYCDGRFPRSQLPPLMDQEDVFSFAKSQKGERELVAHMALSLRNAAAELEGQRTTLETTSLNVGAGQRNEIAQS